MYVVNIGRFRYNDIPCLHAYLCIMDICTYHDEIVVATCHTGDKQNEEQDPFGKQPFCIT